MLDETRVRRFDRRTMLKRSVALGLSVPAVTSLLAACGGEDADPTATTAPAAPTSPPAGSDPTATSAPDATAAPSGPTATTAASDPTSTSASEQPTAPPIQQPTGDFEGAQRGGTLRVILPQDPPTIDMPHTVQNVVGAVIWAFVESLYSYDQEFQLIPMLAEGNEVSSDGLTNTITLRQGVPFHNGDEMKASDAVASISRWMEITPFAAPLKALSNELVEVDEYTIEFQLTEPFGALLHLLAMNNGACPIYPASQAESAGMEQITEPIGTGPYRFVEWQPDRYIRLERFEEYAALPGEPNGYGGHKYAFADEIIFTPVLDEAARVAGLRAGDYDYLRDVSPDQMSTLEGDDNITVEINPIPVQINAMPLNFESAPTDDLQVRQAMMVGVTPEPILIARFGAGFYRLDPSLMPQETAWYSTAGEEWYNLNDVERAKTLLAESGYDGTPIQLLISSNVSVQGPVIQQELEKIGFIVELEVLEPSAYNSRRDEGNWNVTITGFGFKPDPTQIPITQMCAYLGRWCDAETVDIIADLYASSDFDERYDLWSQYQQNFYDHAAYVNLGWSLGILPRRANLKGQFLQTALGITFWNMWLDN